MKRMLHEIPWKGFACLLVTILALLLAKVPAQAQQAIEADRDATDREGLPVVAIQFQGHKELSEQKLRSLVQTRPDRAFESRLVQADVRRLFNSGLVRDVRVLTRRSGGGLVVIFEIFERPTIASVRFIGNRGLDDKRLSKEASLEIGG